MLLIVSKTLLSIYYSLKHKEKDNILFTLTIERMIQMIDILISTKELSSQDLLSWRDKGIGGSDVATICGLNKYKSAVELWMEKRGYSEPKKAGEAAYWGSTLEPIIRNEFSKRTNLKVDTLHSILKNKDFPFMLANVDGIITDTDGTKCIFEAKTASAYKLSEWETEIPEAYMLQIQHYMAVTGYKRTYIAALIGGNTFIYKKVERDNELIEMIIKLEEHFWNCVLSDTPPALDGSAGCSDLLNRLYPIAQHNTIISLPPETKDLISQYNSIKDQEKLCSSAKEEIINKLKSLLGENEKGVLDDISISWKNFSTERLDIKKLKIDYPDIYKRYLIQSTSRRFTIK